MMDDTSALVLKSSGADPLVKLSRMLRNTLRRWTRARLVTTLDGFGVSLDAHTYVKVSVSGPLTDADLRDLLVLFATWLVADPSRLRNDGTPLAGFIARVKEPS